MEISNPYINWVEGKNTKLLSALAKYKGTTQALMALCVASPDTPAAFIASQLSKLDYEIDLMLNEKIFSHVSGND